MKRFITLTAAIALVGVGCGPKIEAEKFDPMGSVESATQEQIKEALRKAGVTKDVTAIVDMDKEWMVTLRPDAREFDGDSRPVPERATINKASFAVKVLNPDGKHSGKRQMPIPPGP